MKKTMLIFCVLVLLCAPSILAQQKLKSFEITPFFNWENFDSKAFLKDSFLYGVKLGFTFSKRMEGEFVYSQGTTDSDPYLIFYEESYQLNAKEDDEVSFWSVNFIYNFKPFKEKFVPFAEAGLGRFRITRITDVYFNNIELGETEFIGQWKDSQSLPTRMLGGGLRYFFTKRYAFRFDVTATMYKHDVTGLSFNSATDQYFFRTNKDDLLNLETSIGFSIFLGGVE